MTKPRVVVYRPDNALRRGFLNLYLDIFREVRDNKFLIYQLFRREFISSYKQSFGGIFWIFVSPLLSVALFVMLNSSGVFDAGVMTVPYVLYAIIGMTFWSVFAGGLTSASPALVSAGGMITKINFSKKSLIFASVGRMVVAVVIQFVLIFILFAYYGYMPSISIIFTPLFVIPLILTALGLGFLFSILNGVIRDVSSVLPILLQFMMFSTPILYSNPTNTWIGNIAKYNPLYYLVAFPRDMILAGQSAFLNEYLASFAVSIVVFIVCILFFHLSETRITERV